MMDAVSECLDGEIEGDFVNVEAADGTMSASSWTNRG